MQLGEQRQTNPTNISAEEYLWNEMVKANQTLGADGLNELVNHSTQLHKSDQYNRIEMEEDSVSKENTRNMPNTGNTKQTDIYRKHRCNKAEGK